MARINVPPPAGSISMPVGENLTIHAAQACTFCCSIGGNFSPDITTIQLSQGDNGPYTAEAVGSGKYNTSASNSPCNPQTLTQTAQSIQITP